MNSNPATPQIIQADAATFEREVLCALQPVLVEFSTAWSRPCHVLDTVLDEVTSICGTEVKVVRVDADNDPDLSLWYGIQAIPTLLYFRAGKVHARIVGTASKEAILTRLHSVFSHDDGEKTNSNSSGPFPRTDLP
jgi:thioredoxin 1